ncbi:hypothetical protein [Antarctobacter sp.]|uniref:COG3904 family protein n=1 Tax=Antarctobacter sp. TaxID=1872577 RepID=UPI003A8E3A47
MYKIFGATLISLMTAGTAHAATIERVGPIQTDPALGCSLKVSGQIQSGDADALLALLQSETAKVDNFPSPRTDSQVVLCLESPGGSFAEAIAMAHVIYDNAVTTRVDPGAECLSACAVAFMGGNLDTRSGQGWKSSRYVHPTSRLGFHAPALVLPEGQFTRDDVQTAYGIAIQAVGMISRDARKLRISQDVLTRMFNHTGEDFHYVQRIDHLNAYGLQLYGYDVPPMSFEATNTACWNAWRWYADLPRETDTLSDFQSFTASFQISRSNGLPEFFPFDGSMFCKHQVQAFGGGNLDRVVQSELTNFADIRLDSYHPQWVRYPGPMPLVDIRPGNQRDF